MEWNEFLDFCKEEEFEKARKAIQNNEVVIENRDEYVEIFLYPYMQETIEERGKNLEWILEQYDFNETGADEDHPLFIAMKEGNKEAIDIWFNKEGNKGDERIFTGILFCCVRDKMPTKMISYLLSKKPAYMFPADFFQEVLVFLIFDQRNDMERIKIKYDTEVFQILANHQSKACNLLLNGV